MNEIFDRARGKPERCRLLLDGELADEHARLEEQLLAAPEADEPEIARQIVELEERIRDAEIEFVFVGIGRGAWRRLIANFPPSEEEAAQGAEFAIDTFPFEAMAVSLQEPRVTADELRRLNDEVLTFQQYDLLWRTCLSAHFGSAGRPESLAAHAILANGRHRSGQLSESELAAPS